MPPFRRHRLLAAACGLAGLALASNAQAWDRYGPDRYGASGDEAWSGPEAICHAVMADERRCHWSDRESWADRGPRDVVDSGAAVAGGEAVILPDSFFADEGGVGPAFADYGGSSGGGFVFVNGGAFAGASASASARVSVSIGFRGGVHGGGFMPGGHGCGCGRHW